LKKGIALKVEGISKCYRIGLKENQNDTIARSFIDFIKSPIKNYKKHRSLYNFKDVEMGKGSYPSDVLWALRDISFEVKEGEVVGIIGMNGAGKSTLLKILTRITEPTSGKALIRGRVSSLLEVGTGFHPELTGRDNIFLNGTILGMSKNEVTRKFDQIVDFSGVEKFLDTPVKRYSSGMRIRLAFAVSAHLEPEVLLIDEVLAVGDAEFQKKCLNKMEEVGEEGRTVLFVSHSMPAITRLCPRTILLGNGQVLADGPSHKVVSTYLNQGMSTAAAREWRPEDAPGNDIARLLAVRVRTEDGHVTDIADIRQPVGIEMEYEILKPDHKMLSYITILNDKGIRAFASVDLSPEWQDNPRPKGRYISTAWIPGNLLSEGTLFVGAAMRSTNSRPIHFNVTDAVAFQVVDTTDGDSARGSFVGRMSGVVRPLLKWNTLFDQSRSKAKSPSPFDITSQ